MKMRPRLRLPALFVGLTNTSVSTGEPFEYDILGSQMVDNGGADPQLHREYREGKAFVSRVRSLAGRGSGRVGFPTILAPHPAPARRAEES
jgi:hypothetical protein